MRRRACLVLLIAITAGAAGCASRTSKATLSTDYLAVLSATSGKTVQSGSSRMTLDSDTVVGAQHVTMSGVGAFAFGRQEGSMVLKMDLPTAAGGVTINELMTGGYLYLTLPSQPGYYRLRLSDLVGTQFAQSSDPTSALSALQGVSGPVTKVGTDTLRGARTTHLAGTLDLSKALAKVSGAVKTLLQGMLDKGQVSTVPFDAWVDDQGRLRKFVEHLTMTVQGQHLDSTTSMEFFDFGTPVSVAAPPASEVRDGAAILRALKGARG